MSMARIAQIKSVMAFSDDFATVNWVDAKGKKGSTSGDPKNPHMRALLDRAKRDMANVLGSHAAKLLGYAKGGWLK